VSAFWDFGPTFRRLAVGIGCKNASPTSFQFAPVTYPAPDDGLVMFEVTVCRIAAGLMYDVCFGGCCTSGLVRALVLRMIGRSRRVTASVRTARHQSCCERRWCRSRHGHLVAYSRLPVRQVFFHGQFRRIGRGVRERRDPQPGYPDSLKSREKFLAFRVLVDSDGRMIQDGFLSAQDRRTLIALARDGSAASRLMRRVNALVLLDDGWS
jgi:hypothetical protein